MGAASSSSTRINRLLADWGQGNEQARDALIPVVYGELRRLARRHLWRERPDHTLQSAALVNEAYLRDAILNPSQHVTAGYAPIMPTYQGQVSEDGLIDLVEYIKNMQNNYRVQQTLTTSESNQAAPTTPGVVQP